MNKLLIFFFSIFISACSSTQVATSKSYESETLKIKPVSANAFVHISYLQTNDYGKVACNGMVYFNENEAIVFDTPVDNETSKELIHWIKKDLKKKIKAVVITHFHNDCLGGLPEFHTNNIQSYANNLTIKLAKNDSINTLPKHGFDKKIELIIGKTPVTTQFYGEGHTIDNIVGYIPKEEVLFGGCLIKSVNAGKGYLGDANTNEWSNTVKKIKKEFPNLKVIIPGHGNTGGTELLDYTIKMFEKKE